ncbi:hypothetical protein FJT64_009812 [Amphibalanus amphitrite]|uniref:Retrotransposon gag domain-containing protein n=1 Tax=Amphibalanus amphitrite TaxID=1232801 RepID=A0A6A4V790_AMPAM|nr:hypothetical protein FJT64_009812 [Amphibalanus amphitrite]
MPGESSEPGDGGTGRAVMEATPAFDARTIPEFDGTGNVVEWLEQAALLCELRAVSLMAVLPTRLRGGAFAVWSRMPPETRHHLSSVKAKLLRAFAMDPFTAQAEMTRRHLRPGETADVYLAALQQLAELMGGLPERAIAIVFVNGLPETVQASVRDGLGESFTLEYVLDRARAVLSRATVCASIDPAPSRWKHGTLEVDRTWERLAMDVTHFRGKTYLTVIDCGPSWYAMWREIRGS